MLRFFWTLLILVAALSGAAYWNYQRNAPLDRDLEQRRPFRTLSEKDLSALEQAYRDELAGHRQKLELYTQASSSSGGSYAPSDLQGRIDGFSKAQAGASRMRDLQLTVREREVELEQIARERQIRSTGMDQPWKRIKRRVLTF